MKFLYIFNFYRKPKTGYIRAVTLKIEALDRKIKTMENYIDSLCPLIYSRSYVYTGTRHNPDLYVAISEKITKLCEERYGLRV